MASSLENPHMHVLAMFILLVFLATWNNPAQPHDGHVSQLPPGFENDRQINQWIASLRSRAGTNCCSAADGYLAEISWKTADGYVVYFEGKEYRVPEEAVIDSPNRVGSAMVWWNVGEEMERTVRCFLPGALY